MHITSYHVIQQAKWYRSSVEGAGVLVSGFKFITVASEQFYIGFTQHHFYILGTLGSSCLLLGKSLPGRCQVMDTCFIQLSQDYHASVSLSRCLQGICRSLKSLMDWLLGWLQAPKFAMSASEARLSMFWAQRTSLCKKSVLFWPCTRN